MTMCNVNPHFTELYCFGSQQSKEGSTVPPTHLPSTQHTNTCLFFLDA